MKILGFVPLHYGAEYLDLCLDSLKPFCDKVYVSYSKKASHGHAPLFNGKLVQCPDSRDSIFNIAHKNLGDKLIWEEADSYPREASHRHSVYNHVAGYDMIVTADSDEVIDKDTFMEGVKMAYDGPHRLYGTSNYINFWRSFNHVVRDGFSPIRMFNLRRSGGQGHGLPTKIFHFGTCQRKEVMEYKYLCHGHKDELRTNWLKDVYYGWTPDNQIQNLHPVANGIWNAEAIDKHTLPDYIKSHPNFMKDLV